MKKLVTAAVIGLSFGFVTAQANIINVLTEPSPLQDDWFLDGEMEELGDAFPADERISSKLLDTTTYIPCPIDHNDEGPANVLVEIINQTNRTFNEVYYVADTGTSLTNVDEFVADAKTPTVFEPAFKIDDFGLNTPLFFESGSIPNVFEPGETWEFVIQNFSGQGGRGPVPFDTLGIAGSSGSGLSTGSIIAVPELSTVTSIFFGLGTLLAAGLRHRR